MTAIITTATTHVISYHLFILIFKNVITIHVYPLCFIQINSLFKTKAREEHESMCVSASVVTGDGMTT